MKKSNDCVNYKRTILFLFCYILCFNLNAQKVHHDGTLIKGKKCLITDNSINVRSSSSIEAEKLFKVNAGDIVTIEGYGDGGMYAEGEWADWYRISCSKGNGYILGRWMTSIFTKFTLIENDETSYIACSFLFEEDETDPQGGKYLDDEILLIKNGSRKVLKGYSVLNNSVFNYSPCDDIEVIQSTGLNIKDPIILFKRSISYGAGKIENCTVCRLHNEERIDEIYFAETVWENSELENQDIFFPQITYDVYHRTWRTSILNTQIKKNEIKIVKTKGKTAPYENIDETDIIEIKKQESIILDLTKVL